MVASQMHVGNVLHLLDGQVHAADLMLHMYYGRDACTTTTTDSSMSMLLDPQPSFHVVFKDRLGLYGEELVCDLPGNHFVD